MGLTAPAAQVTPQQLLWTKTYKDVKNHNELDSSFEKLRLAITQHVSLLQRQAQVRVKNWLKKLSEETANVVWKKNRNAFAKLLLEQLRAGRLAEPFHQMPPNGPLPTLPKHAAYAFAQPRSSACQERRPSASEALDEYLGRQDFRQLQLDPGATQPQDLTDPQQGVLPGTRMQLVGAEARQVDRHQLQDAEWQPSKLELEAQLGASRERERELQWRLQKAEEMLRQQGVLLQQALHAPVRLESPSPPAPMDDDVIDDGHVSPPRKRVGRRELQELIDKYEEKRRQWHIPAWPRQPLGRVSPLQDGEEEEILDHLDNFQRHTEAIRRHLSRRTGSSSGGGDLDGPAAQLSAMSSEGIGFGGFSGRGGTAVGAAAATPSMPFRSGLEPSLGPPLEPLYSAASPTVSNGATRTRGSFPQGLLATTARGRPAGLFDVLPESPRLGAGREARRGSAGQRPAMSTASASANRSDVAEAGSPEAPRRAVSPPVRHTLKSAAAAQKNAAKASPSGAARPSQQWQQEQQQEQTQKERGGRSQGDAAAALLRNSREHEQLSGGHEPSHHQWQGRGAGGDRPPGPMWQPGGEGRHGAPASSQQQLDPDSTEGLASGAADLRRRLEQQLGDADAGSRGTTSLPLRAPLASTSRSRAGAAEPWGRRLLTLEQSSEEAVGRNDWQHPSHKYRLSDMDAGAPGGPLERPEATALGSSSSRFHLAERGGLGESSSGLFGAATPSNRYRLTDDASSGLLGEVGRGPEDDPSLEDFKRQTEAIKAQIAALKLLDNEF